MDVPQRVQELCRHHKGRMMWVGVLEGDHDSSHYSSRTQIASVALLSKTATLWSSSSIRYFTTFLTLTLLLEPVDNVSYDHDAS